MLVKGSGLGAFPDPRHCCGFTKLRDGGLPAGVPPSVRKPAVPPRARHRHKHLPARAAGGERGSPLVDGVSARDTLEHSQTLFLSNLQANVATSDDRKGFLKTSSVAGQRPP